MKHILLLLFFASLSLGISAQTQRLVLIEEATNASCGPCASQNPAFDALLNANRHKLTAIKYHWYFPGYDPMHNHNVAENNARVSYYNINGVPTAVIDGYKPSGAGFSYPGGPHGFTQALIDQYYALPSPFEIDMHHYLSTAQDSIHVIMRIRAAQDITGTFKAHMVVIEKTITFTSPPGSNGEMVFHDVMKKMLPNQNGTDLATAWQEGDYIIIKESWKLANIYNMSQLGVVGFVQQNVSKSVQQAANSDNELFLAYFDTDAALLKISNLAPTDCSGNLAPIVTVANYGSDPLISMDIVYSTNGEEPMIYNWTGNLDFLETEQVELPALAYVVLPENELEIILENVNGTTDGFENNNIATYSFDRSIATPNEVKLRLRLDNSPQDITWDVKDMSGEVVFSGGSYTVPGEIHEIALPFDNLGCYEFTINDAAGNGLQPPGFFLLYYGTNTQILLGTTFGSMAKAQFDVGNTLSINEPDKAGQVVFFPNPVHDFGILEFSLATNTEIEVAVYNLMGQLQSQLAKGKFDAGMHQLIVDASALKPGMYLIRGLIGDQTLTQKITVVN
ncbi:MAG: T9SS type A sorting domain-containing protein [Bacteroidales bacterium]|nr:T9SS type A sorting domain-containing protein [Bacteroidales bacterium]